MNKQSVAAVLIAVLALVVGLVALNESGQVEQAMGGLTTEGVTNFTTVTTSDDVNVGDDLTVAGSATIGSSSLYPILFDTDATLAIAGTGTITGTASYAHGMTTVEFAICAMNQVADTDAGDAARCVATYGSTTVTVTLYQDDWVTQATEASIPISYFAVGQ